MRIFQQKSKKLLTGVVSAAVLFTFNTTVFAATNNIQSRKATSVVQNVASSNQVASINFLSDNLVKATANTATFKYKLTDKDGNDITKSIPASEIKGTVLIGTNAATLTLDPENGVGTVTYAFDDSSKTALITLVDSVTGCVKTGTLNITDTDTPSNQDAVTVSKISITSKKLVKSSKKLATFQYNILDKDGTDITKQVPASQLSVISVIGTKTAVTSLDPSTGTGTVNYKFTKKSKKASITITDKTTGISTSVTLRIK